MTKLTQAQIVALKYIPEGDRAKVTAQMLADNESSAKVRVANRSEFSIRLNENNNAVIRGLGNRFPIGLRLDSLDVLVAHFGEVKAFLDANRHLIVKKATTTPEAK